MKMKVLIWILCILLLSNYSYSQFGCRTPSNIPDILQSIPASQYTPPPNNYVVRIFIHVIRHSNGTGGQTAAEVNQALANIDADFGAQNICVSLLGTDNILNDTYYNTYTLNTFATDANGDGKFDNFSPNSHANAVDIYLFPNDGAVSGGLAANIPAKALVVGGVSYGVNLASSHVVSHELGHCLGLYHTFHGLCEDGCPELVNGSNCTTCGDFVCDTRADPTVFDVDPSTCTWNDISCAGVMNPKDANGQTYNPQTNIIMAYISPTCMQIFTNGQGARMLAVLANSSLLQSIIVPNSLTISSLNVTSGSNQTYDVINSLTAQTSVVVQPNGSLTLRAGSLIDIKSSFDAKPLSNFDARLDSLCSTIDVSNLANSPQNLQANYVHKIDSSSLKKFAVTIHPNPVSSNLIITLQSAQIRTFQLSIRSIGGNVLKTLRYESSNSSPIQIKQDVSSLADGVYFLIVNDGFVTKSIKFIKM